MKSVLVIGRGARDRGRVAGVLRSAGHHVLEVEGADEATEVARGARPDVVVSPLMLKRERDELARALAADPGLTDTPLIFSTGTDRERLTAAVARAAGQNGAAPPAGPVDQEPIRILGARLIEKMNEVEAASAERGKLIEHLLRAHEEERRRIAAALHDDPVQAGIALAMRLELLARRTEDPETQSALEELHADALHAVDRMRHLVFELEPPSLHAEGLASALRAYLDRVSLEGPPRGTFHDRVDHEPDAPTRTVLYRAAQELIVNARKHAEAKSLDVALEERDREFILRVHDDGRGFDPSSQLRPRPGHLGLTSLRERIEHVDGSVEIWSRPGVGTVVEVHVPGDEGPA